MLPGLSVNKKRKNNTFLKRKILQSKNQKYYLEEQQWLAKDKNGIGLTTFLVSTCDFSYLSDKYWATPAWSGFMVFFPGFQFAGQTSPCLSVNWNPWTSLKVSSTSLPTGRSLIVICLKTPLGSIMKSPRNGTPSSSFKTL